MPATGSGSSREARHWLMVLGPGLMVCLADSDIGGLFTMAVAGSQFGYRLLGLQFLLIPVLIIAQQLVVVLGACKKRSLVGLTQEHLGMLAARLILLLCVVIGACAVISEFTGVVAVGELLGLGPAPSCAFAAVLLVSIVCTGTYSFTERVGLLFGACLSVFLITAVVCKPHWDVVFGTAFTPPKQSDLSSGRYQELITANIGTVITPWMLFYQMSAVVQKKVTPEELNIAMADTVIGSILTQLVMGATLITFGTMAYGVDLESMPLRQAFLVTMRPLLGDVGTVIAIALGLLGSSMLAALVVSLGVAWNVADYLGEESPLDSRIKDAPWFYMGYGITVLLSAALVASGKISIIALNISIQVLNGVGMPLVVGTCFYLATKQGVLPEQYRVSGWRAFVSGLLLLSCALLALWMAIKAAF